MEKNHLKEEIVELLEVIIEQSEVISSSEKQIPQIEIDIILSNIRDLYSKYRALEKLNKPSEPITESIKTEAPKAEIKQKTDVKETVEVVEEKAVVEEIKAEVIVPPTEENMPPETNQSQKKTKVKTPSVDLFSSHTTVADKFKDEKKSLNEKLSSSHTDKSIAAKLQKNPIKDLKNAIGINEKFKFINELFEGNLQKYNDGIAQLNHFGNMDEAIHFLSVLTEEFSWDKENEAYKELSELVTRRYQ
jgi:hypothetical protein